MAMVSPKLRQDMTRRTRAVNALKPASGRISATPPRRSSSLPAAGRPKVHDLDIIVSAPGTRDHNDGSMNHTAMLPDLITPPPTKISRIARSRSGSEIRSVPSTNSVVRFRLEVDNDEKHLSSTATSAPSPQQCANEKVVGALGEENLRPSLKMSAIPATPTATAAQKAARQTVDNRDRTSDRKAADDKDQTSDQAQQQDTEISGDSLSGADAGVEADSLESCPSQCPTSGEEENVAFCREKSDGPALDLGMPGKLMELMEDRDKAVHLCLQYRCKLKTTESSLRTEERRGSGLKRQLREATAAGETTKKVNRNTVTLFEQMMEKARVEEREEIRRGVRASQDEKASKNLAEEARKARLQLARAQKDLRDLWLERDELDALAKQATQGEEAGRRRARKLEQVNATLRQKADAVAMSGKKVAEEKAHAEARALAAEVAERDLRAAVEAIKRDFEVLVCDLHLRGERIQQLEEENSALAAAAVDAAKPGGATTVAKPPPFPRREHLHPRPNATESRIPAEDETAVDTPAANLQNRNTSGSDGTSEGGCVSRERRGSDTRKSVGAREGGYVSQGACASNVAQMGTAEAVATSARATPQDCELEGQSYGGGGGTVTNACALEAEVTRGKNCAVSIAAATSNSATVARHTRRQLNPQFAVIPGRVTAISYPRRGSRVTIELPVEKKPLNEEKNKEPGRDMDAVGGRASVVPEKAHDDTEKNVEALGAMEKAHGDTEKVEEQSECGGQAAPCPQPPLPRWPSDKLVVGPTPAPPLPSRPSNLSVECAFSKAAPLLSDGSVCTAVCTPDAKLRSTDKFIDSLEGKPRLGDVAPTSVAEETGFGGNEGISGNTEGRRRTTDGVVVESAAATLRSAINDVRNGGGEGNEAPPNARVGEDKREDHSVEAELSPQSMKNEDAMSDMFASRLVDGAPVLKYGGKGKPKPKVLWVTPDLSELFYTRVGRTKNSKRTSHMPLAGLYAVRGRSACPDLVGARHDRCFALLRDGTNNSANSPHGSQGQSRTQGSELTAGDKSEERQGSTAPGRLRWGLGGSRSPSCARGKSWRGGEGSNSMGRGSSVGEQGSPAPRPGARERMGLETASVEECDALVAEINHLVRRAGSKEDVVSSRGREIFHEWCRSAVEDDEVVPLVAATVPLKRTGGEAQSALVGGRADT